MRGDAYDDELKLRTMTTCFCHITRLIKQDSGINRRARSPRHREAGTVVTRY